MAQRGHAQWHDLDWLCFCSGGIMDEHQMKVATNDTSKECVDETAKQRHEPEKKYHRGDHLKGLF
jgi:hypothetical protein